VVLARRPSRQPRPCTQPPHYAARIGIRRMDTVLTFEGYISAKRDAGQELTTAGLLSYEKARRNRERNQSVVSKDGPATVDDLDTLIAQGLKCRESVPTCDSVNDTPNLKARQIKSAGKFVTGQRRFSAWKKTPYSTGLKLLTPRRPNPRHQPQPPNRVILPLRLLPLLLLPGRAFPVRPPHLPQWFLVLVPHHRRRALMLLSLPSRGRPNPPSPAHLSSTAPATCWGRFQYYSQSKPSSPSRCSPRGAGWREEGDACWLGLPVSRSPCLPWPGCWYPAGGNTNDYR
jgi:hypothetical protein